MGLRTTIPVCCTPIREGLSESEAVDLASCFAALSDPVRLRLLSLIANADGGRACSCDLIEPVGKSQPTVSHHLRILHEAGLVEKEKVGTWVWYSPVKSRVAALRAVLKV